MIGAFGLRLQLGLLISRWDVEMPAIIAKSIAILSDVVLGMAMFSLCMFQFERSSAAYCHCSVVRLMRGAWRNEPNPDACKVDYHKLLLLMRLLWFLQPKTLASFSTGEVQCEQPNNSLYTFTGNLIIQKQTLPLIPNQILLRLNGVRTGV